jgi:hypothetical protein
MLIRDWSRDKAPTWRTREGEEIRVVSVYSLAFSRMTEIAMIRASNICLTWNCIWRCTSLHREMKARSKMALDFVRQVRNAIVASLGV